MGEFRYFSTVGYHYKKFEHLDGFLGENIKVIIPFFSKKSKNSPFLKLMKE